MKSITDTIANDENYNELQREFAKIVIPLKDQYRDYVANYIKNIIERNKDEIIGKPGEQTIYNRKSPLFNLPFKHVIQHVFGADFHPDEIARQEEWVKRFPGSKGSRGSYSHRAPYGLDPNYMDRVNKAADEAADNFHDGFVAKNARKFADLLGNKKIAKMSHTIGHSLDGMLKVELDDGSSFKTTFNTVSKRSVNGVFFNQWPTKFTDVKFADGTKMSTPSEAKMKQHFATNGKGEGRAAPAPEPLVGDVSFRFVKWPGRGVDAYIGRKKVGPAFKKSIDGKTVYGFGEFRGTRDEVFAHIKALHGVAEKPAELDTTPLIKQSAPNEDRSLIGVGIDKSNELPHAQRQRIQKIIYDAAEYADEKGISVSNALEFTAADQDSAEDHDWIIQHVVKHTSSNPAPVQHVDPIHTPRPVTPVAGLNHPTGMSKAQIVAQMVHAMPGATAHAVAKAVHQHHPQITMANAQYYARKLKGN